MDLRTFLVCLSLYFLYCGVLCATKKTSKGFYCKDPDTNILHTINSTWPSTTFCGNYTCKLRKVIKNTTTTTILDNQILTTESLPSKDNAQVLQQPPVSQYDDADDTDKKAKLSGMKFHQYQDIESRIKAADRYLSNTEVKDISNILQNVKISDLETLLDLYNVAKGIFTEIGKDGQKADTSKVNKDFSKTDYKVPKEAFSYWYDPHYNKKKNKPIDLKGEGSHIYGVQKPTKMYPPLYYFNGALSSTDFGKLPYYYPVSSFQRYSSYIHDPRVQHHHRMFAQNPQKQVPTLPTVVNTAGTYDPRPICNQNYVPPTHTAIHETPIRPNIPIPEPDKLNKLLPYPFTYMHRINASNPQRLYFGISPWMQNYLNMPQHPTQAAFYSSSYVPNVLLNPEIETGTIEEIEQTPIEKAIGAVNTKLLNDFLAQNNIDEKKSIPNWRTNELPPELIEEIRANVLDKSKTLLNPFPIKRNKIKMERIGKFLSLDKIPRMKRALDDFEDAKDEKTEVSLEAYIEKTTCKTDYEVGFFSMGNSSLPYPGCCPKRLEPTKEDVGENKIN